MKTNMSGKGYIHEDYNFYTGHSPRSYRKASNVFTWVYVFVKFAKLKYFNFM